MRKNGCKNPYNNLFLCNHKSTRMDSIAIFLLLYSVTNIQQQQKKNNWYQSNKLSSISLSMFCCVRFCVISFCCFGENAFVLFAVLSRNHCPTSISFHDKTGNGSAKQNNWMMFAIYVMKSVTKTAFMACSYALSVQL